ncbi:MAG TPA: deoxyguanosinetriphosphate triphosphohydrolase [Solibacterales bacterium]|nr:deoxyguanosinetriphosphate triphosphohydrolase [Bryobacterales bacterium]
MAAGGRTPLGHLRFPVAASQGRRYPETFHPYRNEFQRDRDRVIHSRAFRRLENKTQVFTPSLSDHFRNRLTHTMEVAQIARTVASALGLDEDLTEALALVHDIGHPPFAHAGEEELDRQMRRFGERFDHNLHALRIVERFEQRYARFPGLNLTYEVREGIAKHSSDLTPGTLDEYAPHLRPPLEAQLIDLADETAYNTADLDDAYSAGLFSMAEIGEAVPEYGAIREEIDFQFPASPEKVRFQEALRRLVDLLVSGLIEGTVQAAHSLGDHEAVRAHPVRVACYTAPARETSLALKAFLRQRVYFSPDLVEERRRAAGAIGELFGFYLENPGRLPEGYLDAGAPRHRAICDYIAGMTDGFFERTYRETLGAG